MMVLTETGQTWLLLLSSCLDVVVVMLLHFSKYIWFLKLCLFSFKLLYLRSVSVLWLDIWMLLQYIYVFLFESILICFNFFLNVSFIINPTLKHDLFKCQ